MKYKDSNIVLISWILYIKIIAEQFDKKFTV